MGQESHDPYLSKSTENEGMIDNWVSNHNGLWCVSYWGRLGLCGGTNKHPHHKLGKSGKAL